MNKCKRKIIVLSVILTLVCILLTSCSGTGRIKNGDFEKGSGSLITNWSQRNYEKSVGDDEATVISFADGFDGKCIKIASKTYNDARIYQKVKLRKKAIYKVTVDIMIEGELDSGIPEEERGSGFNISAIDSWGMSQKIYTTNNEWVTVTAYIQGGPGQKEVELSFGIGGYGSESKGTVYIDNVTVEKVKSVPSGYTLVSVEPYAKSNKNDSKSSETPVYFKVLFIALVLGLAVFVILLISKRDEELYKKHLPLSEDKAKLGKRDLIIISIMTVVCAVTSFYKLGNAYGPESYWKPEEAGEYVTVEFDEVTAVARTSFLPNIPSAGRAGYTVYYEDTETGEFKKAFSFARNDSDAPEFFEWKLENTKYTTKKVRIECDVKGMPLNEMAFWKADGTGYKQISATVIDSQGATAGNLFDEQKYAEEYRTFENGTYFDEIYFPRTAYEHINGYSIYECTHPPLGKSLMSLGILIFGMNPLGWRFVGTFMGVLLVPLIYLFAFKLFKKSECGFLAAFLMMFDFMRTTQTRLATIDTYSVFFIILMYYFMYDYFSKRSYELPFLRQMAPLALSGICFGLGAACKWTSIYAGLGLAILFFMAKFSEAQDVGKGRYRTKAGEQSWFVGNFIPTCVMCLLFFVLIPGLIYVLSYIPYMASNPDKTLLQVVIDNQKYMYNYHSNLNATHPYQSPWYQWIFDVRPIYYYSSGNAGLEAGMRASVVSMGNPAIWWTGVACIPAALYFAWKKREKAMVPVFIGYACQLFPWILVTRCTFIYHYFTAVPFLILMIVYTIKSLINDKAIGKFTVIAYLLIVLILYIMFYPVMVGIPVKDTYISDLRWFETWSF